MNWEEEYRRLALEMKALEAKLTACAARVIELENALKAIESRYKDYRRQHPYSEDMGR
jgi:hypothetical protein